MSKSCDRVCGPVIALSGCLLWVSLVLAGCVNTSTFHSGTVLEPGQGKGGVGVSVMDQRSLEFDDGATASGANIPVVSGWYRLGVSDRVELHGMLSMMSGAEGGVKYGLRGRDGELGGKLATGAIARLGGMRLSYEDGRSTDYAGVADAVAPLYLGYRFSDQFAAYLTPQYVFRGVLRMDNEITHLVGSNLGVAFGTGSVFLLDIMGAYDVRMGAPLISVGFGATL